MSHISDAIRSWASGQGSKSMGQKPATMSQKDPLHEITDHNEWLAAIKARREANKHATYARHRHDRYADASYATLTPQQAHGGKIARWLESGLRTLILAGPSRTGKTTAAYAITNYADAAGLWCVARTAADLSDALKPDRDPVAYQYAIDCDLLLIDDLGRERVTDWWMEQLQKIVDDRCGNKKRMIVTTNSPLKGADKDDRRTPQSLAFDTLADRYGHPLAERLLDGGGLLVFDGPPVREVITDW